MSGLTFDEVGSKPKASKATASQSPAAKGPNRLVMALNKAVVSPRLWVAITCLLLGISAGTRLWRDGQFYGQAEASRKCPFPLDELPKTIGSWRMIDGSAEQLDPEIARVAGEVTT